MAAFRFSKAYVTCFIITSVVSQQQIVSVDEIENGGTFSVTCDASRFSTSIIPSSVTKTMILGIRRRTSQDTSNVQLAQYRAFGTAQPVQNIPPGRQWTVDFTGSNGGTNNRNTMKIVILVSDAVCADAGIYTCEATYEDSEQALVPVSRTENVTAKSAVQAITLDADKYFAVLGRPNYSEYQEGDNITLTCRINGPQDLEMMWKTGTYDTFSGFITSDYPYDNDITTADPTLISSGACNTYGHISVLNLRSLSQDVNDQVMYLCVVMENDQFNAAEVSSANITIGVNSKLCPKDFCKNGGTCVGLDTCECSSTDFFGPTCQYTREELPVNIYVFASIDPNNNIVVTSSGNLTFHGSVTLRRQDNKVSLVIPAESYVALDGPVKTSCLGDIDTCTSGFTITITHSFSSVSSTETLVALTTGAHLEAGVKGVSLYYESGNVNCYVVTSTQEWSIVQKFTLIENKWYNMTVSWHVGQGLDLLLGNDVIGSDITPDKLPVKATDERPILIGSETKTTSNSEMNLEGILTSPVFWREIQRAGIYFTKEPSSESFALEIAQIVGIAVGCFAALVFSTVAVVGLVYYIRRTSKDTPQTRGVTPGVKPEDDGYVTPMDYAYSMSTSNTHNNSNSQEYETFSHYDYITDDYLTLEPETTFNNSAPVLPNPRGSIENTYDRRVIDTGNPEEAT